MWVLTLLGRNKTLTTYTNLCGMGSATRLASSPQQEGKPTLKHTLCQLGVGWQEQLTNACSHILQAAAHFAFCELSLRRQRQSVTACVVPQFRGDREHACPFIACRRKETCCRKYTFFKQWYLPRHCGLGVLKCVSSLVTFLSEKTKKKDAPQKVSN